LYVIHDYKIPRHFFSDSEKIVSFVDNCWSVYIIDIIEWIFTGSAHTCRGPGHSSSARRSIAHRGLGHWRRNMGTALGWLGYWTVRRWVTDLIAHSLKDLNPQSSSCKMLIVQYWRCLEQSEGELLDHRSFTQSMFSCRNHSFPIRPFTCHGLCPVILSY